MEQDVLQLFSEPVRTWFTREVGTPTLTQELGWPALAARKHALVCAPTGTGKTLCAFLHAIDRLMGYARQDKLTEGVKILYISPLKALGNDIDKNLDRPLEGIARLAPEALLIGKMVRTGDTGSSDRRRMSAHPPHILITTPESLYLMLTSKAAEHMFGGLETVIIDEVHALLGNKRGTHLSLSLERLSRIADYQRVGLSATVEPMSEAAQYLGGMGREVTIVDARAKKAMQVLVESVVDDYRVLPEGSIWPEIGKRVHEYAHAYRQVLVFTNDRRTAENVAMVVNRIEFGDESDAIFAATHHGSIDKERRLEVEQRFKSGELRCLCATSSLELGIDIGSVDMVLHIAAPFLVAAGLQRLGRAGHRPGEVSLMRILPRTAHEALECALTAAAMLDSAVEPTFTPKNCLDVLAQHIVSMACRQEWTIDDILKLARGAYPYEKLTREELLQVLRMLRGDFEHAAGRDARPRIFWDENQGTIHGDTYARMLATAGGTIPDRGYYKVVTPEGARVGELEEEFVYEVRQGNPIKLGAFSWRIMAIHNDRVIVAPFTGVARVPFWRGGGPGRASIMGERFGRELAALERAPNLTAYIKQRYPVDDVNARAIARIIGDQIEALHCLPTDRRIIAEHFCDESGECYVAFQCVLGERVNRVLAFALKQAAVGLTGRDIQVYQDDDGILLHMMGMTQAPRGMLAAIDPDSVYAMLLADLPSTQLFSLHFRQAAAVALMLGGGHGVKRIPLWVQRLRGGEALSRAAESPDHPIIIEAYRECLERVFEVDRAIQALRDVRSGVIQVVETYSETPSRFSAVLLAMVQEVYTYGEATPADVAVRGALASAEAVIPPREAMERSLPQARDADALYALLLRRGTLSREEIALVEPFARELIETGRAVWAGSLMVASHEAAALGDALDGDVDALTPFLLRHLRAVGEAGDELAARFGPAVQEALDRQVSEGTLVAYERNGFHLVAHASDAQRAINARARERRAQVRTVEPAAYAALLPIWQEAQGGVPASRIGDILSPLCGLYLNKELWEDVVLPARVSKYKPRDLDQALLTGDLVWRLHEDQVAFFPPETAFLEPEGEGGAVLEALKEGGAQFARQISRRTGVVGGELEAALRDLVARGLIVCDGFAPMRAKKASSTKEKVRNRVGVLTGEGRWEAAGQPAPLSDERRIDRLFARWGIVSRECAEREGISWASLMDALRRLEFADEVRRGYFVRGLSGAQFVRASQYERITRMLEHPEGMQVLCAVDPAQAYGQLLGGAGFMCVPGTAVVLAAGAPVLAVERQGEVIRFLGEGDANGIAAAAIVAFAEAFMQRRIWPRRARITAKTWPDGLQDALRSAGFVPEMRDFTLWRD